MKKSEQKRDFRGKNAEQLGQLIAEKQDELMKLKFKKSTGQLEQTGQIKDIRRMIARVKTLIKEQAQA